MTEDEEYPDFRETEEVLGIPIKWKFWDDGNSETAKARVGRYWVKVEDLDGDGGPWRIERNHRLIACGRDYDYEAAGRAALATVTYLINADREAAKERERAEAGNEGCG